MHSDKGLCLTEISRDTNSNVLEHISKFYDDFMKLLFRFSLIIDKVIVSPEAVKSGFYFDRGSVPQFSSTRELMGHNFFQEGSVSCWSNL